jgi:HK97 family phage portal protein
MSLFGLLEKRSTLANPDRWMLNLMGGRSTGSGLQVSEQGALAYTALYSCVQVVADAIACLPVRLYRREPNGDQVIITDQPVAMLLGLEPNGEMGAASFKASLQGWTLTWGNGFAEIERNNAGLPIALHPLGPNRIVPQRRTGDGRIQYYVTRAAIASPYLLEQTATEAIIDQDDMFHIAGLGFDGIIGYSPVSMAREAIGLGLGAEAYGARFFGNDTTPGGVLEHPKTVKDPDKLRKQFEASQSGTNQRRVAVLEDGLTWKSVGIPPQDSQFLETRKFQRSEICSLYRVPPHKIGDLDRATNNNIEQQEMQFVTDCLQGWLVRWEQEANRKLLTREQRAAGYFFEFDLDERLRGDMLARFQAYAQARNWGWMSANDVLRRERKNRIGGPEGDIYLSPGNMINAATLAAPAAAGNPGWTLPASQDPKPTAATVADPATPPPADRAIDAQRVLANFRSMLTSTASRAVRKESQALRRAGKKPDTFTATATEFYKDHADHIRSVMIEPATAFADILGITFGTVRQAVDHAADKAVARAREELPAIAADVDGAMDRWEATKATEIADSILLEIQV